MDERVIARFLRDVERCEGSCWGWRGPRNSYGYARIELQENKKRFARLYAHRVAFELFHGPIPPNMVVRHDCDNPPCCNPDHLRLGTQADNVQDAVDRQRFAVGQERKNTILTEEQVREGIEAARCGATHQAIAINLGVTRQTVGDFLTGRTWQHLR